MPHGGDAARPTTVGTAEIGMAGAVRGSEAANIGSAAFDDAQLGAAAARRFSFDAFFEPGAAGAAYHDSAEFARHARAAAARGEVPAAAGFHFHHQPGPGIGMVYASFGEFGRQPGPVGVVLVDPRLPDGIVLVHGYYGYAALQPRQEAGRGVVLDDLLTGGFDAVYHNSAEFARHVRTAGGRGGEVPVAVFHREPGPGVAYPNNGEFWRQPGRVHVVSAGPQLPDVVLPVHDNNYGYSALQPRPGVGRAVVLADLLSGGGGTAYNGDYAPVQPRRGAEHGEVLVDLLPDDAGHGEVLVELMLPSSDVAAYDHYGYYAQQTSPDAGQGEVFLGPLPDVVGAVFDNSGNLARQTLPGIGRADGIAGALRGRNLDAGHDGSGALAGAAYNNLGMVGAEHLRRLLPFAGIGACSVAVNGLAAGPGSPAVAFDLFAMFLGGLLLVILYVLRA